MSGSVTVSVRSIVAAALVLLALVTAYLLGGTGDPVSVPAAAAPQQAATPDGARVVRMVGTGEVSAVPDRMSFALSTTAKRLDLGAALAVSSRTLERVLAALQEHGVENADVQTTGLSMHPEYDYRPYGPPTLTGYRVTQRAQVTIDELGRGGRAVAAAVAAGGNGVRVRDIRLGIGDPEEVLGRARDRAVEAATTKAEQYAAATGQTLGDVVSIRELGSTPGASPQVGYVPSARMVRDTAAVLPVRAGRDDLRVRIGVVWSFE